MPPLVSVILPTLDRMEFLRAAVESVLWQTDPDWELIIADGGSGEETKAYLRSLEGPRVRVLFVDYSGRPSVPRNAAIRAARGTYLAFLDSDDIWAPAKLEVQRRAMRATPDRRWSYTALTNIDTEGRTTSDAGLKPRIPYDGDILERVLSVDAIIGTSAVMVERRLVEEIGGFDEEQAVNEDYDLWMRLAMRSPVTAVAESLVFVRHKDPARYPENIIGAYEGWIRLYGKMLNCLAEPRLRAIARRRRAQSALQLAWLYADAGDQAAARRTLREALSYSWIYPGWAWGAVKAALPASWRSFYRKLKRRT